jgi:L,D-transpeptidase-like protein
MIWATTSDKRLSPSEAASVAHDMFCDDSGKLKDTWDRNDFGKWSWNLTRGGRRTAYYLHTTPDDEENTAKGLPVQLLNSHGCVHVRPADRDKMEYKKYLKKGTVVIVHKYGEVGPPK